MPLDTKLKINQSVPANSRHKLEQIVNRNLYSDARFEWIDNICSHVHLSREHNLYNGNASQVSEIIEDRHTFMKKKQKKQIKKKPSVEQTSIASSISHNETAP